METLKNFFIGLLVVIMSLIIIGIVLLTWPILIGISSILLSVIAAGLLLVFIFYIVVLIGYVVRQLVRGNKAQ